MILGDLTMSPRAHSGTGVIHEADLATDGQIWQRCLIIITVSGLRGPVLRSLGTEFISGRCTVELPRSTNATCDRSS